MTEAAWRPGGSVQVRNASEILATLDDRGETDGLPFMPELVAHCGARLEIDATAERMCDTINWSGSRRLPDTVLLGSLRCDGSGHDGCQGECRLLWKTAWLRPAAERGSAPDPRAEADAAAALLAVAGRNTRQAPDGPGAAADKWRCQLTEMFRASAPSHRFPYVRELTSGNVGLGRYARVIARALVWETKRKLGRLPRHCFPGTSAPVRRPPLQLQPGEWVRIRRAEEIEATIDLKGGTRGLWFDREMLQYCGRTARVRVRATRFVHDDGTFVELKSAAFKLDGVTCKGDYSVGRWFCPRALYPFWREDWLERVPPPKNG
jgi:hypothetical protein